MSPLMYVPIAVVVLGMISNSLSISAWLKSRQNPFSVYFCWISIVDLLTVIVVYVPQSTRPYLHMNFDSLNDVVCAGYHYLAHVLWCTYSYLFMALILDRTLSLPSIRKLNLQNTRQRAKTVCVTIVVVSAVLKLPHLLFARIRTEIYTSIDDSSLNWNSTYTYEVDSNLTWNSTYTSSNDESHVSICSRLVEVQPTIGFMDDIIIIVIQNAIPLFVDIVCLILICVTKTKSGSGLVNDGTSSITNIIVWIGLLFWIISVSIFISFLQNKQYVNHEVIHQLQRLMWLASMLPLVVNPLIYCALEEFRWSVVKTLTCVCCRQGHD